MHRATGPDRFQTLLGLAQTLPLYQKELAPWLLVELGARPAAWIEELEAALVNSVNASVLVRILPPFYASLDVPDRAARTERIEQRAIQLLLKDKQFAEALMVVRGLATPRPKLEAVCLEGVGDFRAAAERYRTAGMLKEALNCYRSIPDLEAALNLVREIGEHPAAESLEWISRLKALVAERPEKFTKVVTPAEKKILEGLLEQSLGVTRRKPVPRTTARKPAAPRKRTPRKPKAEEYF